MDSSSIAWTIATADLLRSDSPPLRLDQCKRNRRSLRSYLSLLWNSTSSGATQDSDVLPPPKDRVTKPVWGLNDALANSRRQYAAKHGRERLPHTPSRSSPSRTETQYATAMGEFVNGASGSSQSDSVICNEFMSAIGMSFIQDELYARRESVERDEGEVILKGNLPLEEGAMQVMVPKEGLPCQSCREKDGQIVALKEELHRQELLMKDVQIAILKEELHRRELQVKDGRIALLEGELHRQELKMRRDAHIIALTEQLYHRELDDKEGHLAALEKTVVARENLVVDMDNHVDYLMERLRVETLHNCQQRERMAEEERLHLWEVVAKGEQIAALRAEVRRLQTEAYKGRGGGQPRR